MGKWAKKENEDYKLSEESAEKAVRELLDFYECGVQDDNKHAERIIDSLAKAFRRGELETVKDDIKGFCILQHIKTSNGKNTITYRELSGDDRIYLEGFDYTQVSAKTYSILGRVSGLGEDAIKKLKGNDWSNALALSFLFTIASGG